MNNNFEYKQLSTNSVGQYLKRIYPSLNVKVPREWGVHDGLAFSY